MSNTSIYYWNKGRDDFKSGKEFWECPYCSSLDDTRALPAWFAGWCWQKQEDKKERNDQT